MKTRTMYALALSVYLVFVVAIILTLFYLNGNEDAQLLAIYSLSTGLLVCTLILALFFFRDRSSDRYSELYPEQDDDWEKKD